jgi:hypothetical protein
VIEAVGVFADRPIMAGLLPVTHQVPCEPAALSDPEIQAQVGQNPKRDGFVLTDEERQDIRSWFQKLVDRGLGKGREPG